MCIDALPDLLRWDDREKVLTRVHAGYVELLADRLGAELAGIRARDDNRDRRLSALLDSLPDRAFIRFITAPETSCRLLWRRSYADSDVADFIYASLTAERLRLGDGLDEPLAGPLWTALGDFCHRPDGTSFSAPALPGLPVLDFESPYANDLDFSGRAARTLVQRDNLDAREQSLVLQKLAASAKGVERVSPMVHDFVRSFTKVLVLQRDPEAPAMFASGSSGQFIGRSVLSNPQLPGVDAVEVAEGLIHESIHALLYMQEQRRRWVDPALYGPELRTQSPWTGNSLPLRPYLQACFVWYGLLHFWAMAYGRDVFPAARVRQRIIQCVSGFLDSSFEAPLRTWRAQISADLLDAIHRMRRLACEVAAESA